MVWPQTEQVESHFGNRPESRAEVCIQTQDLAAAHMAIGPCGLLTAIAPPYVVAANSRPEVLARSCQFRTRPLALLSATLAIQPIQNLVCSSHPGQQHLVIVTIKKFSTFGDGVDI